MTFVSIRKGPVTRCQSLYSGSQAGWIIQCAVCDVADYYVWLRLAVYEDLKGAEAALRTLTNAELDGRKIYLRKVGWCSLLSWCVAMSQNGWR